MSESRVIMTVTDGVADVRFNRPDKLNALDEAQFRAIAATIAEIEARRDIRCVLLSGAGRAFSVGARCQGAVQGSRTRPPLVGVLGADA